MFQLQKMTSVINNQAVTVQLLTLPEGTGLHNNTSASLAPTKGSIAWDDLGTAGVIYSGTGLEWKALDDGNVIGPNLSTIGDIPYFSTLDGKTLADSSILYTDIVKASTTSTSSHLVSYNGTGGRIVQDSGILSTDVVLGPASVVSGRIASYNGTTGKLLADGGKLAADVVTGPASAIGDNFASFDLTTGKLIKDSGISCVSTSVTALTMTNASTLSPNLTNCTLYLQKITIGAIVFVQFELKVNQTIVTTSLPDVWYNPAAVPVGYRPTDNKRFPCIVYSNVTSNIIPGCDFIIQSTGIIDIYIYDSTTVGSTIFQNYSGVYQLS